MDRGIYVFYQYANALAYSFFDGGKWQIVNQAVPNTLTTQEPASILHNNKIYCFHQGSDSGGNPTYLFWYNVYDGSNWAGDQQVGHTNLSHSPSAAIYNDQIYVFHQGATNSGCPSGEDLCPNGELWYNIYQGGGNWSGDTQVPNTTLHRSPSAIVWNSEILCFHKTDGSDNTLWLNTYTQQNPWPGDNQVSGPSFANSPAVITYNGKLWCFYQSNDGSNTLHSGQVQLGDPDTVANDNPVPNATLWYSPAPCVFNNRLYCFHHSADDGNSLYCQVFVGQKWAGEFQVPGVSIENSPSVVVVE
jgi:hypothetical protein